MSKEVYYVVSDTLDGLEDTVNLNLQSGWDLASAGFVIDKSEHYVPRLGLDGKPALGEDGEPTGEMVLEPFTRYYQVLVREVEHGG
jgi:hypothetical protein